VLWLWIGLGLLLAPPLAVAAFLVYLYFHLLRKYLHYLVRIFQEKPLFVIPRGEPMAGAEEVRFPTSDGLLLHGCYLRRAGGPGQHRRGVILFGVEFGANCWSCVPYCEHLLGRGFDVFVFEPRGQGESDALAGYEPLQWVTEYDVADMRAAVAYLKSRPDADPHGIGLFGISKGAGAGVLAAEREPYLRCFVTDGVFATYTTMVPYMRKWIGIYSHRYFLQRILPDWYYGLLARAGLRRIRRERRCRFPDLEPVMSRLTPRPILMIHGGADTYIKPEMAEALHAYARPPKEFWLVDAAKHNQALQTAGDEYRRRVLDFFLIHLQEPGEKVPAAERAVAKAEPTPAPGVAPSPALTMPLAPTAKL
jgi:pimeloyl-ACP methyl ester carboxylesterase